MKEDLNEALKLLFKINPNIRNVIGWTMACFIKEKITSIIPGFPILAFQGEPGSGKTATSWVISKLHGVKVPEPVNLRGNTVSTKILASSLTPVIFEEFNRIKLTKAAYEKGCKILKEGANGFTSQHLRLLAPCIVISEKEIEDKMLSDRCIVVKFEKPDRAACRNFRKLNEIYLPQFADVFKKQALIVSTEQISQWLDADHMSSHEQRNYAIIEAGLFFLRHVIKQLDLNCVRQFNDMNNYRY